MNTIFIYGTLKRGYPNFDPAMKQAVFLGNYRTRRAFPLVIGGPWRTPYLLPEVGQGHQVIGELFRVDDDLIAELDDLEDVDSPTGYRRVLLDVELVEGGCSLEAWTYMRDRQYIDGIHTEPMVEYPLDGGYVVPALRPKPDC